MIHSVMIRIQQQPQQKVTRSTAFEKMGLFDSFREHGWNTYYDEKPAVASFDLKQAFILYMVVVVGAAMMMVVIGTRGNEVMSKYIATNSMRP